MGSQQSRALVCQQCGRLTFAAWTGTTFSVRWCGNISLNPDAGLLVDEGWHKVYFLDVDGHLSCARRSGTTWESVKIGDETLSRLLFVDRLGHSIFAYDPTAGGIRCYRFREKVWVSSLVTTGLGEAGDAAAWDSVGGVFYSSHETADAAIPRDPHAHSIGDPTGLGAWKPWPLVATSWDGKKWSSKVVDETGVPQLPAVSATNHIVYYARRDELDLIRTYRPASGARPAVFGSLAGWSGADTFEDNNKYAIKVPVYPNQWTSSESSFLIVHTNSTPFGVPSVQLQAPLTVIPYYEPVWSDAALPPRLAHFRAVLDPRLNTLVQHRQINRGEVVRTQTGKRLAGYLYRDANGVLARKGVSGRPAMVSYPVLTDQYDPANPPAAFAALADSTATFFAEPNQTSLGTFADASPTATVNADAAFAPPSLRLPTSVLSRTFGHAYDQPAGMQAGGRYRYYSRAATTSAIVSSLAVDLPTGVAFYTQSQQPPELTNLPDVTLAHSSPPLAGFRAAPDLKLVPSPLPVWIVMVY